MGNYRYVRVFQETFTHKPGQVSFLVIIVSFWAVEATEVTGELFLIRLREASKRSRYGSQDSMYEAIVVVA